MLSHYLELLRHFWRTVVIGAVVAGGLALVLSVLLLRSAPVYQASVTLNMQPSEEELRFNSAFMGVSQFNPATIIAQTHIERLLSRQVARRAVEILIEESGGSLPADPPGTFDKIKAAIWRTYNVLNFGYFEPQPQLETYISDLINATEVEIVEGSYILLVSVSYDNPQIAAQAANILARAYIEQTQEELAADATRVDASLQRAIETREAALADSQAERQEIAESLGLSSVEGERAILLENRTDARSELRDSQMEQALLDTRIGSLEASITSQSDAEVVRQLRQTLAETQASRAGVEARLDLRAEAVTEADRALRQLDSAADAFADIDERIIEIETDLEELRGRRVGAQLAREAQLSQVRTIDAARAPVYPKFPKVLVNTIVATIVGAILVLVPVAAMDVLGDSARTSEDLRRALGGRVLPTISRRLLRQARAYNTHGKTPGGALRAYADAVGRRFVSEGAHRWPSSALLVTAFGSQKDVSRVNEVMRAVMQIAAPTGTAGSPPGTQELPPVSRIADLSEHAGRHLVVGLRPGTVATDELDAIGRSGDDQRGPEPFAVLLP